MRLIKKTASIIAGLIIILAIGGYIFVRNFDLNRYKPYIEETVLRETGRKLTLAGEAQLGISLVPTVDINDVTFSNPDWASYPDMVKLQKLEVKFAIMPLFRKQIVVDKLILQEPQIYLETTADGAKSWEFSLPSSGKSVQTQQGNEAPQQKNVNGAAAPLALGLVAREVSLQNGLVLYYDAKTQKTTQAVINEINFETAGSKEPIYLSADMELDGQTIVADFEANNLYSIMNQGMSSFKSKVRAYGVSAEISGTVDGIFDVPRYGIAANIHNPAGNFSAPETSLEAQISGDVQSADIQIEALDIATNLVTGTAKVDWSGSKPSINANLETSVFNLESLNKNSMLSWQVPSLVSEAQALEVVPNDKIPYELLNTANAFVKLYAGKLIVNKDITLTELSAVAKLQNGILDVSKFNFGLGGGEVEAKLSANAAEQSVSLDLTTRDLKIQELHKPLASGKQGNLQVLSGGVTDIFAKLASKGATYRQISENLDGQVIAILNKSEIKTGASDWLTNNIFAQLLSLLKVNVSKNTDMNLECAVVRSDIKNGRALFPNGVVFNASKLKLLSNGEINLRNDKIDFTIVPSLNKLADGDLTQALASFVKVGGTLTHPKVQLDKTSALTTVVGTVMTGGVYLGSEVLLDGQDSPCYTALKGTSFADRFPKPTGVKATTKNVYQDVNKQAKDTIKDLGGVAKELLGAFKSGLKQGN